MRKLLVLSVLTLAIASCGMGSSAYPYAKEPDPRSSEFVIGVSDRLRISVWKNPELNSEIQVRPDGTITMPLIGDIQATGRTPTQLKQEISERLKLYVREEAAVVTVAVTEVNSYRVTISGNVMQPGMYSSTQFLTVADAIALAGGPARFADADETVIVRRDLDGKIRRIPIDYESIVRGKRLEQNLVLKAGDTVFVP